MEKAYPNCREKTQRQLEQSDQVPDLEYAKNAKPTPKVRPFTLYSNSSGGGRGGRYPIEELRYSSSSVYSSSRLARGRGHTHWPGELKTTDSRVYTCINVLTGDTNSGSSSTAASLHNKQKTLFLKKCDKRKL